MIYLILMRKTRQILFRVTASQYERIKNNAQAKGHKTMASYLRDTALNKSLIFEERFMEIYKIITKK